MLIVVNGRMHDTCMTGTKRVYTYRIFSFIYTAYLIYTRPFLFIPNQHLDVSVVSNIFKNLENGNMEKKHQDFLDNFLSYPSNNNHHTCMLSW